MGAGLLATPAAGRVVWRWRTAGEYNADVSAVEDIDDIQADFDLGTGGVTSVTIALSAVNPTVAGTVSPWTV